MSLLRQGKAQCLSIYIGETDQWQGMPLYVAIVQLLREQGNDVLLPDLQDGQDIHQKPSQF